MKIYIIAGEASGDLHGSNLIKAIKKRQPTADIHCWGGDLMEEAGAKLIKHYRDLAFMGFAEVILNLRTIFRNIRFCKEDIEGFQPDAIILIDYPGFNLRIAKWAHHKNIKVFYYISPQIWAWKQNRVYGIKATINKMHVVLPFEKAFYKRFDYDVEFVGHPLLDAITSKPAIDFQAFCKANQLSEKPIIALLPGSRKQEIEAMLPLMLSVTKDFPDYQFVIAGAPGQDAVYYKEVMGESSKIQVIFGKTYDLFQLAKCGLVTSGTATLEAGIFKMPQVVCYKAHPFSYMIARRLVKIKYISLVNLILDRAAVTELIQLDLNYHNLKIELVALLTEGPRKEKMKSDYDELHTLLGGPGASDKTAKSVLKSMES